MVERIKQLCKERGTTIKQLEATVGIANGVIRKWDEASPKAESLKKVADYFGVSVDYLMGREGYLDLLIKQGQEAVMNNTPMSPKAELVNEALELLANMDEEKQKAAIAQLQALAALKIKE